MPSETRDNFLFTARVSAKLAKNSIQQAWSDGKILRKPKELLLFASAGAQYHPLPGRSCIRLLHIEPGKPHDILRCSLRTVDLAHNHSYIALSYTWRRDRSKLNKSFDMLKAFTKNFMTDRTVMTQLPQDLDEPESFRSIVCGGKPAKILPNLHEALLQLRRRSGSDYWIDALCINQEDMEERAWQVQMMGRIYAAADSVIVWLGTAPKQVLDGVAEMERLSGLDPDFDLSSILSVTDGETVTAAPGTPLDSRAVEHISALVGFVMDNKWFRRLWVVQEFCWAKQVSFAIGNGQLNMKDIINCFRFAKRYLQRDVSDEDVRRVSRDLITAHYPQLDGVALLTSKQIAKTIQAREAFQQGSMWTLKQWLEACKGRRATDDRDMLFGGLSLIKPELHSIDTSIRPTNLIPTCVDRFAALPLRKYYPQVIPCFAQPSMKRAELEPDGKYQSKSQNLLPNGLWTTLSADYTASETEVLMNLAACLLTHTGTADILSAASRMRHLNSYSSEWLVSPDKDLSVENLPSWVPKPGSWTSHILESLATECSCRVSVTTEATARQYPRISTDGTALLLEASDFDSVSQILLSTGSIDNLDFVAFRALLDSIESLTLFYQSSQHTSLAALSRTILYKYVHQENTGPDASIKATQWLCWTLCHKASKLLISERTKLLLEMEPRSNYPATTCDDCLHQYSENHESESDRLNQFMDLFEQLQAKYAQEPWPGNFSLRKLDVIIHMEMIRRQCARTIAVKKQQEVKSVSQEVDDMLKAYGTGELGSRPKRPDRFANLEIAAFSGLSWRNLFITKGGLVGLGPKWLSENDSILLVQDAPTPYIFSPADADWRREERELRQALDENEKTYLEVIHKTPPKQNLMLHLESEMWRKFRESQAKELLARRKDIQQRFKEVMKKTSPQNALVLVGEAYIQGIMHGETEVSYRGRRCVIV